MRNKKEIIKRNFIAGMAKGVGMGIGFSIISAIIVYILQKIIKLNIPAISDYITYNKENKRGRCYDRSFNLNFKC